MRFTVGKEEWQSWKKQQNDKTSLSRFGRLFFFFFFRDKEDEAAEGWSLFFTVWGVDWSVVCLTKKVDKKAAILPGGDVCSFIKVLI